MLSADCFNIVTFLTKRGSKELFLILENAITQIIYEVVNSGILGTGFITLLF
jgi:hypothetical protein